MEAHIKGWNQNFINGRINRYPFDQVISFVLNNFSERTRNSVKILDLGCGGGNNIKFLMDEGFDFYGVDGSEKSIEITKELIGKEGESKIFLADFKRLPFLDNQFDAIIDRQAMGHNILEEIKKIISEIYRVLKVGGILHSHVFSINDRGFLFGKNSGTNDFIEFTEGHFSKAFLVHGFDIDEIKTLFREFSQLQIERHSTFDALKNEMKIEIFVINAKK